MIEQPPKINFVTLLDTYNLTVKPEMAKLLKEINDRYYYWDKVKYQPLPEGVTAHELWAAVKFTRKVSTRFQFGRYTFTFGLTDYMQRTLHYLDLHVGGYLGTQSIIPDEEKNRYLVNSIMEEAIASSQMEGAVTTRKIAKDMLRKDAKPRNKHQQMIVNNYLTIKHIVENKYDELTPARLLQVHKLMSNKTLDNVADEGCFRTHNDIYVVNQLESEVAHTPPSLDEIPGLV